MPGRYTQAHASPQGPGDARPTGLQIITDEGLENKMTDKVFLVTGASSGIGIETGRALAATGGKVFLGVRNLTKGKEACESFLEPGRVELLEIDLASLQSVRDAAATFLAKSPNRLNVLVNNAGIMAAPYSKTIDGFESQFGTNHLGHFLLFMLVKDAMLASSTPEFHSRVINVSSSGHHGSPVILGDYNFERTEYTPFKGYGQAKTANMWMANEIENRYGAKGLHGISLHPGGIWTGLQKFVSPEKMEEWKSIPSVELIIKSEAQGAATSVIAAVGKEYEGRGRFYMSNCEEQGPSEGGEGYAKHAFDKEKEAQLWKDSLVMVGLQDQD